MTMNEHIFRELDQQIVDLKGKLRMKKDLERSLTRARQSLKQEQQRLWDLKTELAVESADVEALETLSLRGLFFTVLGSKEERQEKEQQELAAAKLRYDEAQEAIEALKLSNIALERRLEELGDVEGRYRSVLEHKEQALLETDREEARRLLALSEAQADAQSDRRELREAISAGRSAANSLDNAVASLRGAGNWGAVDLLGGGLLTTAVKHGRIDEARRWIHQAQQELRRFRRELADLEPDVAVGVELGAFETFADYFFDGLIADWVVQTRINNSLDRAVEMRRHVQSTVDRLRRELRQTERRAEQIREERQRLIERA